jgi:hypothetical protein
LQYAQRYKRGCLAAAAVLAAGPGTASSVTATAKTWTVHPGGAIAATAGKTTLTDTKTGTTASCENSEERTVRPLS